MSKAKRYRASRLRPRVKAAAGAATADLSQALGIDWSTIDWTRLLLEVALVAVDWALLVVVPLLQKAGGPLAPIVSMILTSAKQIVEQQLQR
jgi:hypothetical protein